MKVLTFTRLNLGAYIGPRYKRYRNLVGKLKLKGYFQV